VLLFPSAGALGMVTLRLVFSAAILLGIARPRLRGHRASHWAAAIAFGIVLAGMNATFYEALTRLPLGTTVTIEVLGPLVLSVVVSRRVTSWLWAVLAFGGVALLGRGDFTGLDLVGVAFAFGAAALWACYILLSSRVGSRFPQLDGLAIAMSVGAIVMLPFGLLTAGPALAQPNILLLGLAVAVLSSTIPYALELLALRRIPASTFSILMSLAPAIAATAGFVILRQRADLFELLAIVLVVAASIGAVRAAARHARRSLPDELGAAP
jgi:inner membrane transporter RhtA